MVRAVARMRLAPIAPTWSLQTVRPMPTSYSDKWLTPADIAAMLGQPLSTVYKWSAKGQPSYPRSVRLPNGDVVVRHSDFERWLEGRTR